MALDALKQARPWIYLGNVLAPFASAKTGLSKVLGYNPGNPLGALLLGGLDFISMFSDNIKNSRLNRLVKTIGIPVYAFKTLASGLNVISYFTDNSGNIESLAQLPFDASMLYQLTKDTFKNYADNSLVEDIKSFHRKSSEDEEDSE